MMLRLHSLLLMLTVVLLALPGCSGKGPDVIDPNSGSRTQTAFIAVNRDYGELFRYNEATGALSADEYRAANPVDSIIPPVDAIYEHNDNLYLHHRGTGSITVLEMKTRRKVAQIGGFPSGIGGALTGMAFSNASQGWVVSTGSPNLYHIDIRNNVIADTIPLPAEPTNVGTNVRNVFVGMRESNGSGKVAIFRSNPSGAFTIEKTLNLPSPVIYSVPSIDSLQFILLTAGGPGEIKPKIFFIGMATLEIIGELEIDAPPLTSYIGAHPSYAAFTRDEYLYLALPSSVIQIDTRGMYSFEWYAGSFSSIAFDYQSGLFYGYDAGAGVIKRRDKGGIDLPDINLPGPVSDIQFVASSKVQ